MRMQTHYDRSTISGLRSARNWGIGIVLDGDCYEIVPVTDQSFPDNFRGSHFGSVTSAPELEPTDNPGV